MSKKTLPILLILPFIFSLLFFVASNILFTRIDGDVSNIVWEFKNHEGFALKDIEVELKATPITYDNQEQVDMTLYWSCRNIDDSETPHAYVDVREEKSYLVFVDIGDIEVKVSNVNGNISKTFNATIYEDGVILLNTLRNRSFNKIDPLDYYGEYDFIGDTITKATFKMNIEASPKELEKHLLYETSSNITYNSIDGTIYILESGKAYLKVYSNYLSSIKEQIYNFNVIKNGYNVYSYDELLKCTSSSNNGEIVCLQTNLETFNNTFKYSENGALEYIDNTTELFGNLNTLTNKYNFENEVYRFESTYNTEYIDQYNEVVKDESKKISKEVIAGIRIQKDFYGNGYCINAHNLTYPTKMNNSNNEIFTPEEDQLFKGPLPFIIIGNSDLPLVKAYGQDNIGFYVDGDNIVLNDVYFKNANYSTILQNNDYIGTVLEINGDNVVIKNSVISSGRTVLRAFSCSNLIVDNSLLEKGREFIAKIGSNKYEKMNMDGNVSFTYDDVNYTMSKEEFFKDEDGTGSMLLKTAFEVLIKGITSSDNSKHANEYVSMIQSLLNDVDINKLINVSNSDSSVTFNDTYFYQSGIFSLALDSMFNGPYLYDGSPLYNLIGALIDDIIMPSNISGVSYPSLVILTGDTRFYDYKKESVIDASCLVYQDVSSLVGENISIDNFFPVKSLFVKEMNKRNYHHIDSEEEVYYNTPIVKYGGGLNLSSINIDELENKEYLVEAFELDTYKAIMSNTSTGDTAKLFATMIGRCVPMAMGFAPFEVMVYNGNGKNDAYLFGNNLSIENLKSNLLERGNV